MDLRRSERQRKPKPIWEAELASATATRSKSARKTLKTVKKQDAQSTVLESGTLSASPPSFQPPDSSDVLIPSFLFSEQNSASSAASNPKSAKKARKTVEKQNKHSTGFKNGILSNPPSTLQPSDVPNALISPISIWDQKGAPSASNDPIISEKAVRTAKETALEPIPTESFPLDPKTLPKLPDYNPPLNLQFQPSETCCTALTELEVFQQLLTPQIVDIIVRNTNSYAEYYRKENPLDSDFQRPWKPVNSTDIWRYIGILLYMGAHIERKREEYWRVHQKVKESMSLIRWEQIHRYFTIRHCSTSRSETDPWYWSVEPVSSIIRQNCTKLWMPCSHLAIDESMVAFRGRTFHKVKLPHKPIKEGYKMWVLGDGGYTYTWLWHSRVDGPEGISQKGKTVSRFSSLEKGRKNVQLAPTFALIFRLAQYLRQHHPDRIFCLFLDNLFLTLNLAQALLSLRICCAGTTRKNAQGIPSWLIQLKNQKPSPLVWNSTFAEVVEDTLCFLWQDNNTVLGLTTAHYLKDETVLRFRKRPFPTSTNARVVRPVFGDLSQKWLYIPQVIDDYNHYMNGVDRANQLRRNLTVHRPFEHRNWRPLWDYMVDVCAVNSSLIWEKIYPRKSSKKVGQRPFREALIQALLTMPYEEATHQRQWVKPVALPCQGPAQHQWERLGQRRHCVWCKTHSREWVPTQRRAALTDVTNTAPNQGRKRESMSLGGCRACGVYLCLKTACFKLYHSNSS